MINVISWRTVNRGMHLNTTLAALAYRKILGIIVTHCAVLQKSRELFTSHDSIGCEDDGRCGMSRRAVPENCQVQTGQVNKPDKLINHTYGWTRGRKTCKA